MGGTPFFDLYPELADGARREYQDITLEQLLSFRAGIQPFGDWAAFKGLEEEVRSSRPAFVRHVLAQAPGSSATEGGGFEPVYSNASYTLAAAMLERATAETWEELIERTLWEQRGLAVGFGWPNARGPDAPWGHASPAGGIYSVWLANSADAQLHDDTPNVDLRPFPPGDVYALPGAIAPAGDLSLSPRDYAEYIRIHLRGLRGEDPRLSRSTFERIHFGHDGLSLGVANLRYDGERIAAFDGSAGTFYTHTLIAPKSNFALVILVNSASEEAMKGVSWVSGEVIKALDNLP